MSREGYTDEQTKNKRARHACLNCRRKKTRCPGELPACSFCIRLQQYCQYAEPTKGKNRLSSRTASNGEEDIPYWDLIARVAQLEQMVRRPVQPGVEHSLDPNRSQQEMNNSFDPNSLASIASSAVKTSSPRVESYRSLEDSGGLLPLSSSLIQISIDAFFSYSHNQPYSFFCESSFRLRVLDKTVPDYLLYAVVASAARFMDDEFRNSNFGSACAQRSWELLSKHMDSDAQADLSSVQATTLLALFDFTACKSRTAWRKIGIAARTAQDLKSMFEPDPSFKFQDQEEQRRTFWSIYMLDALVTCGRARPPIFQGHFCKVHLPCTELSFRLGLYEKTQNLDQALSEAGGTDTQANFAPFARVVLIVTILSRATQYVMQDVNIRAEKPPWNGDSDYAAISSSLCNFECQVGIHRSLQEALNMNGVLMGETGSQSTEHIVFSYAIYHLTQCLLNHHFFLRRRLRPYASRVPPTFATRAFNTCREHAQSLTSLIKDAQLLGCQLRTSFLGYCALIAGSINSLHQYDKDANIRKQSKAALDNNIEFLTGHSRYWNNGKLMLDELQKFNQHASGFKSLIVPEIIELNFNTETVDWLYNLADYSIVSRHHGNSNFATPLPIDYGSSRIPGSIFDDSGQWLLGQGGDNPVFDENEEKAHSQVPMLQSHMDYYAPHLQYVPEVGVQHHINQGVYGVLMGSSALPEYNPEIHLQSHDYL